MNTRSLYDRVCLTCPVDQNAFVAYFNDTVQSLISHYDMKYVYEDGISSGEISHINDMSGVRDVYADCIADNIMYLISGNDDRKVDFVNKADLAYKTVWREMSKNRRKYGDRWM